LKIKGVKNMTLNLLFFTVIIRKRKISTKEYLHQQRIEKLMDEHKNRQITHQRLL